MVNFSTKRNSQTDRAMFVIHLSKRIQKPARHLRWYLFAKLTNTFQFLTLLAQLDGVLKTTHTALKTKCSIKDFSSKCEQVPSSLRVSSHLLEKFLIANFIYCAVPDLKISSSLNNR